MSLSIVIAMDENRLIGNGNKLPWHMPADLAYFKKITTGKTVVMGRKTHYSIGFPLPNRRNIVITRNPETLLHGCEVVNSIEEMRSITTDDEEVMVIGGASLCEQILPQVDKLYITKIDGAFDGDVHFPLYNELEWREWSCESHLPDENNPYPYQFIVLVRVYF
jgi:dihydrofolate reductase